MVADIIEEKEGAKAALTISSPKKGKQKTINKEDDNGWKKYK